MTSDSEIRSFRIEVSQAQLDDLVERLARTRWTQELPADQVEKLPVAGPVQPGWQYGVPLSYVQELVALWRDGYDWRAWEQKLNAYPQFTTTIDGQNVHFLHVPSADPEAIPLILTHGWPNSVVEYLDLIGPLTDPRAHGADGPAFHVVIPSIPGFGFSGPTHDTGWGAGRTAKAWAELMRRLGYGRYGAHGNDAGAIISPVLGRVDSEHVIGVHVNQIFSFPSGDPAEFEKLTPEEMQYLGFLQSFVDYAIHDHAQQRQPQTLAHALADSPAGQLAWTAQLLAGVGSELVLTNATIYWLTNTAASAGRFYYECAKEEQPGEPTTFPIGLASFALDFRPIRAFVDRDHHNVVHWSEFDRGSHWSAHDATDLLIEDIRKFFTRLT